MSEDRTVVLPSGRVVQARSDGPHDAPAILYFHGTPDSRLFIDVLAPLAVSSPVRVIAFDRPGYGGSDAEPFTLGSVAEDAGAVMDAYGVDRFAAVGQSGGGPFALATAARWPDRVTGVGSASGAGCIAEVPGEIDMLVDTDKQALALLPEDPEGAARLFALGFADLVAVARDDDAVLAAFAEMLPPDADVLTRADVRGVLPAALREAFRQGVEGAAWDNVAWVGPWDLDFALIRQPTWLWYGDADPLAIPANAYWLKEKIPHAEVVMRAAEGHMGIVTHFDEVAAALASTLA